jgi:gamma-glutamylcyclotransferase (GGCT)/AIG2-like uncharacterized protein YtfP
MALLAAYGTLLPGCGGIEYLELEDKVSCLLECIVPGQLWLRESDTVRDSFTPALIEAEGLVRGHLLEVNKEAWPILDRWEGVDVNLYQRKLVEIEGEEAWVYYYQRQDICSRLFGSWLDYLEEPQAAPLFPLERANESIKMHD